MYVKMTPEQWITKLLAGKYRSTTSALKSIAKTEWSERTKENARGIAEQNFNSPGSICLEDITKKVFKARLVEVLPKEPSILDEESFGLPNKKARAIYRLGEAREIARGCTDFLSAMQLAQQLYPDCDVSDGILLVEKVLRPALVDFVQQANQMPSMPDIDVFAASVIKKEEELSVPLGVVPIIPNYTDAHKELFDSVKRPVDPFQQAAAAVQQD